MKVPKQVKEYLLNEYNFDNSAIDKQVVEVANKKELSVEDMEFLATTIIETDTMDGGLLSERIECACEDTDKFNLMRTMSALKKFRVKLLKEIFTHEHKSKS